MVEPLHPDLSKMSIHDLWCLTELFENLADVALNFTNQPRVQGPAFEFASDFMEHYGHHYQRRVMEAIKARVPATTDEAELRAQSIVRYWAGSDSYDEVMAAVLDGKVAVAARRVQHG